ncbi:hypothetical protein QVD17_31098 [Tagetes erecta]|uniref:Uncharacterized protein n=1 Tax=Tagetes erecta TaxID=13708 RepID=A0AAD8K3Y8_TARER|nr:hypothetical protein QVD17_31098 [Tagetes erecta]
MFIQSDTTFSKIDLQCDRLYQKDRVPEKPLKLHCGAIKIQQLQGRIEGLVNEKEGKKREMKYARTRYDNGSNAS